MHGSQESSARLETRIYTPNEEAKQTTGRISQTGGGAVRLQKAVDLFLEGYFATCQRSDKTIKAYTLDLDQFCTFQGRRRDLQGVTPEHLEEWAEELKEAKYASTSIRRKFASLKVFFNYWVRKRQLERSPAWNLRLDLAPQRVLTKALTQSEMEKILKQARQGHREAKGRGEGSPEEYLALRNLTIVEVLYATAMRVGELVTLKLDDFREEESAFVINGKGGRQRLAFLPDRESKELCRIYFARRRSHATSINLSTIFTDTHGRPVATQTISRWLSLLAREGRIGRPVTPHMIRHTAATLLLRNGADLRVVQEYLGHSSITTTQRYTHVSKEHLQGAVAKFHPKTLRSEADAEADTLLIDN
jgi:site-specific recombinase XerD